MVSNHLILGDRAGEVVFPPGLPTSDSTHRPQQEHNNLQSFGGGGHAASLLLLGPRSGVVEHTFL